MLLGVARLALLKSLEVRVKFWIILGVHIVIDEISLLEFAESQVGYLSVLGSVLPAIRDGNDLVAVDERLLGLDVALVYLRQVQVGLDPALSHDVSEGGNLLSHRFFCNVYLPAILVGNFVVD